MDYVSDVLDEIALEGLDGITIKGLWSRLSERPDFTCAFNIKDDVKTQAFFWSIVKRLRDVEFFVLPNPRKALLTCASYMKDNEKLDDSGESSSTGDVNDIYPHVLINVDGVIGSCSTYYDRNNVSKEVRKLDLVEVNNAYGDKLVVVASQLVRHNTLIEAGINPNIDITGILYCVLERIGRSRFHGETTQGKYGLSAIGEDAKSIFYLRKQLLKHNLIRKQAYQQTSSNNFAGLLLHLPRFYNVIRPKYIEVCEHIAKVIKASCNDFADYYVIGKNLPGVKKLCRSVHFKKLFRMEMKPFREVYPEASDKQWKTKSGDKEKQIRVIYLRDPNLDPSEIQNRFAGINEEDEDEYEDDKDSGILDESNRLLDVPTITQLCKVFKEHKGQGLTQLEIASLMGLQKVQARTTLKTALRMDVIGSYMVDNGRQRTAKYYYKYGGCQTDDHNLLVNNTTGEADIRTFIVSENGELNEFKKETDFELNLGNDKVESTVETNVEDITFVEVNIDEEMSKKRKAEKSLGLIDEIKKFKLVDCGEPMVQENKDLPIDEIEINDVNDVSVITDDLQVESDIDKLITVTISEDYNWLIPHVGGNKLAKLKEKSLNTLRLLTRSNLIVETVHKLKVTDTRRLALMINKHEFKEGLTHTMDKKSLYRILYKLASSNYIKVFRVRLQAGKDSMDFNFVCDLSVELDDPKIKSVIGFNKLKFHSLSIKESVHKSAPKKKPTITYEKRSTLFYLPKFNRMSILHKFLFYLLYDYSGNTSLDQEATRLKIIKQDEDDLDSMPTLYMSTTDEWMFVPPLPHYESKVLNGWCLLSDVIVRLPLALFLSLVQIQYYIPEIDEFMNHPIKKYYLIKDLPTNLRKCVMSSRKYMFSIYDDVVKLVYIGLVQIGAQLNKEKDQVFVFLNKNTVLMDTTSSLRSYNTISTNIDYPVFTYHFENLQNVHEYWYNCWKICMNTNLGMRTNLDVSPGVLENINDKQDMINSLKAREFLQASEFDIGQVPGDKLGAAGFDSALYSHLKRNWFCNSIFSPGYSNNNNSLNVTSGHKKKSLNLLSQTEKNHTVRPKSKDADVVRSNVEIEGNSKEGEVSKGLRKTIKTRIRKAKVCLRRSNAVIKALHRKPYYDTVDKEALKYMSKLRVDWSSEEDRTLLICKVAATYLCTDSRKHVNAFMFRAYREVLHKMFPQSKNKTSRACQRRVLYMLRSSSTLHNLHLCVEELKLDDYMTKKYGNIMETIEEEAKVQKKKLIDMGAVWQNHFKTLVDELLHRYDHNSFYFQNDVFNKQPMKCILNIPNTLEEFYDCYYVQLVEKQSPGQKDTYDPVMNKNDIYSSVINSLIHSSLSCDTDDTSWSCLLFSIYRQYNDNIVRNVLNRMRSNHMVSYRKSYQVKGDKTFYMPLSAAPFQLSISYVNLMQTRYQWNMYEDCYKTYCLLNREYDERKVNNLGDVDGVELYSVIGGQTAAVIELFNRGNIEFPLIIPKQVITLDPNVKNKDESYSKLVQRYEEILKANKKDLTCTILFQKYNFTADNETNEDESGDDSEKESNEAEDKYVMQNVAKASSRIALFMVNEKFDENSKVIPKDVDHVYDFFLVKSCKVFGKLLENFGESHNVIDDNVVDCIIQDLCSSIIFLSNSIGKKESDDLEEGVKVGFRTVEHNNDTVGKIITKNFDSDDIFLVNSLLEKMKIKKEFGLTNKELINEFGNSMKIVNILDKLTSLWLVLKTGVVYCRYVYYLYSRPWLLCSFRKCQEYNDITTKNICSSTESPIPQNINDDQNAYTSNDYFDGFTNEIDSEFTEENWTASKTDDLINAKNHKMSGPIKLIMRPWIIVNGTFNKRVLDLLLSSVLSHIMLYPGISLLQVQNRFTPAYQPQNIREACDILIRLECVSRYCISVRSKPSLFSKPCVVSLEESTGLEPEDNIRYEATILAITNLGKFFDSKSHESEFNKSLGS